MDPTPTPGLLIPFLAVIVGAALYEASRRLYTWTTKGEE